MPTSTAWWSPIAIVRRAAETRHQFARVLAFCALGEGACRRRFILDHFHGIRGRVAAGGPAFWAAEAEEK